MEMKIGKKIMVGYGVVLFLLAVVAAVSSTFLGINYTNAKQAYEEYGEMAGAVGAIGYYYNSVGNNIRDAIIYADDLTRVASEEAAMEQTYQEYSDYVATLDINGISDEEEKRLINDMITKMDESHQIRFEILNSLKEENVSAALATFSSDTYTSLGSAISSDMNSLFELMSVNGNRVIAEVNILAIVGICVSCGVTALGLGLAVYIGFRVSTGVSRPLARIEEAVDELADGNLHMQVHYTANNEIGNLAKSYNHSVEILSQYVEAIEHAMEELSHGNFSIRSSVEFKGDFHKIQLSIDSFLDAINEAFGTINQAAEQVSSGSDQVSSGAQALSQGATQQASAVEQLDATINDISQHVKESASNAEIASQEANDLGDCIIQNNQQMQEMIAAMAEISRCSDEISRIIKTIQDIAFQTNILALNAAVEAARAGAAGKGFAVVADEVRNLASKSSEAAKDTTSLIENSVRAVKNGMDIANNTAQSLEAIVSRAQEMVEVISKISIASNEQADAITQVTNGIDQISSVVQTNSATAQESAAASQQLSGQSQMLKQMIGQYRLRGDSASVLSSSSMPSSFEDAGMGNDSYNDTSSYDDSFSANDQDFSINDKY